MPANHRVSVGWQIVFLLIPVLNFWAFYRIRKLQKYLLYVVAPSIITAITVLFYIGTPEPMFLVTILLNTAASIVAWSLFGLSIYLIIIWSREHNRQFDQAHTQAQPPQ